MSFATRLVALSFARATTLADRCVYRASWCVHMRVCLHVWCRWRKGISRARYRLTAQKCDKASGKKNIPSSHTEPCFAQFSLSLLSFRLPFFRILRSQIATGKRKQHDASHLEKCLYRLLWIYCFFPSN